MTPKRATSIHEMEAISSLSAQIIALNRKIYSLGGQTFSVQAITYYLGWMGHSID